MAAYRPNLFLFLRMPSAGIQVLLLPSSLNGEPRPSSNSKASMQLQLLCSTFEAKMFESTWMHLHTASFNGLMFSRTVQALLIEPSSTLCLPMHPITAVRCWMHFEASWIPTGPAVLFGVAGQLGPPSYRKHVCVGQLGPAASASN